MTRAWQLVGKTIFWLAWPALYFYLKDSRRSRIAVRCDDKLLVARIWISDGAWSLPGGGAHKHESAEAAAARELFEETAISVDPDQLRLIGLKEYRRHGLRYLYDAYEVVLKVRPEVKKQKLEISELAWLTPAQLATQSMSSDVAAALAHWQD
jgi:8-oxo-dGTP pyrophosphatase MutT (NUDIX family)